MRSFDEVKEVDLEDRDICQKNKIFTGVERLQNAILFRRRRNTMGVIFVRILFR